MKKMTDRQKQDAHNARKVARRRAEKAGKVKKGDGKDVDHVRPLSSNGSNTEKNTRVVSQNKNRSEGGSIGGKRGSAANKKKAGSLGGKKSSRLGVPNKKGGKGK